MKISVIKNELKANRIRSSIVKNKGYCPCALYKNEDTKCMCKEFRDLEVNSWCNCGLYYKEI